MNNDLGASKKDLFINLTTDLPKGVGIVDNKGMRSFDDEDYKGIVTAISNKMDYLRTPEENIVFDVYIKGIPYVEMGGMVACILSQWEDVNSVFFVKFNGKKTRIWPRD